MNLDKQTIKENFSEDIEDIKRGHSTTTYYIEEQGKLKPRSESTPNNLNTSERVMELATGHGNKVYQNPLQFAIAVKGFEDWCIDRNVAPSYAGLAYYLNISKDTLIKYTRDNTKYICYNIIDNINCQRGLRAQIYKKYRTLNLIFHGFIGGGFSCLILLINFTPI